MWSSTVNTCKPFFYAFSIVAFSYFSLFSLIEFRWMMSIMKARNPAAFAHFDAMRRELSIFYMKFYTILLVVFFLNYFVKSAWVILLFAAYSFWIPQIASNVYKDMANVFSRTYIGVMSVSRLLVAFYFFGYSDNFLRLEPHFVVCMYLSSYVLLQAIVLHLQDILGPRFFIPKRFLPEKYNYYQQIPEAEWECVICMVRETDAREQGRPLRDYMITPCNHIFHSHCLLQWMQYKMECPTCRQALPPP